MNKIVLSAAALCLLASPALAGNKHNQFQNWQHNQQYNETYNYNYNYNYKYKNHNNNNGEAWAAVGGFIGGFILGNMDNGYGAPPPVYVPPAYVVPGQPVERCGTIWTMEPDGFGGWERTPHTVCGY